MTANEAAIRRAYQVAEAKDIAEWENCFTEQGTFIDESIGVTYRGQTELGRTVEIYATAFPDMHRELYQVYAVGDRIVVELALQGTHKGPLELPIGTERRRPRRKTGLRKSMQVSSDFFLYGIQKWGLNCFRR